MFHKLTPFRTQHRARAYQSGSALVVAIFIIVVMALLATIIARVLSTSATASVDEVYGTRALLAANSGLQVFAVELIDAMSDENINSEQVCRSTIDEDNTIAKVNFTAPGLNNCSSEVSCEPTRYDGFGLTLFQITSTGSCSSANQRYSRVISVEVVDGHF